MKIQKINTTQTYSSNKAQTKQAEANNNSSSQPNSVSFGQNPASVYRSVVKISETTNLFSDPREMKLVQDLLDKCHYGKKDIILGNFKNLKAIKSETGIEIKNFYTAADYENSITGICQELSDKVGKKLQETLGDKYIFFRVSGGTPEFPQGHVLLGAMKKTEANQKFVQSEIDKVTIGDNLHKEFLAKCKELTEQGKFEELSNYMTEISQKGQKLKVNLETLKEAVFIDPSYNRIFNLKDNQKLASEYSISSIGDIAQINAIPEQNLSIPNGIAIPLGHAEDLIPNIKTEPNTIVGLEASDGELCLNLTRPEHLEYFTPPPNSPLGKVLSWLNKSLEIDTNINA